LRMREALPPDLHRPSCHEQLHYCTSSPRGFTVLYRNLSCDRPCNMRHRNNVV
jgi:hypothetical protein